MTPATELQHQPDIREYLRILRARKLEIAVVTVVLVAATMFFTFRQTPIYEGQAKVFVKPVATPGSTGLAVPQAPNLDTERELVLSQAVAAQVQGILKIDTPTDQLLKHVTVQVVTDTEILVIKYDSPDPATAARLANGFAGAYVQFRSQQATGQFQVAAQTAQQQISKLNVQLSDLSRRINNTKNLQLKDTYQTQRDTLIAQLGVLQARLSDLQGGASTAAEAAQVVQPAEVPGSPASPSVVRNTVLAVLAGLALGVGFAFLRERLDERIKTRHDAERRLGAPLLAAVPRVPGWKDEARASMVINVDPKSPASEAYRTLATNVQYLASRGRLKLIMLTSALGGEGKSTTSANLAVALAQPGKRVIVISADLRRPRLHEFFGVSNEVGLSSLLAGHAELADSIKDPRSATLRILPSGPVPDNAASLLAGERAVELLWGLRELADYVLIDTPPVLAVADASILAPMVDGTLFIMDAQHSRRSAITQARDQLENAGAKIIGGVYNNFDPGQSSYYPYYYYNYYQYYGSTDGRSTGTRAGRFRRSRAGGENGNGKKAATPAAPTSVGFEDPGGAT